ncbi:CoA-transferase, partial [Bacillus pseudomycoides]|uniref:CoA-transferase n=1 Tax=Bacillus pseudomycoides TaxID=64104 RepID=UPI002FFE7615
MEEIMSLFHDDMTLMFGGFGGIGSPPSLIQAIAQKGIKNLHLIGNDTGFPDVGIGRLVTNERVKSLITSH